MVTKAKSQEVKDFSDVQEGWEEEATFVEFPPYWTPEEGKGFQGKVLGRDETGDFPRYIIQATAPCECARGSGNDAEPVAVEVGDQFSVSEYSGLPLSLCFGLEIKAIATGRSEKKTKNGFSPWNWKLSLPIEDRKIFKQRKAEANNLFSGKSADKQLTS